jgi:hypothetical protein
MVADTRCHRHQDYGYWYQNGFLYPDFATAFIALDPSIRANGCLQARSVQPIMGHCVVL